VSATLRALRPILEDRAGGLSGKLVRAALWPMGLAMSAATKLRRSAFQARLFRARTVAVPVVSVGNLTAGGTGKTPLVALLAERVSAGGRRPAVAARGYAARKGHAGDEERVLCDQIPGLIYEAGPDRAAAAARAAQRDADVVILDDGFQHLRLARNLDIVALDATHPFGGGRVLPAGLLREPVSALGYADLIVLTHTDELSRQALDDLEQRVRGLAPDAPIVHSLHEPASLTELGSGTTRPIETLHGECVVALSAIGRPQGFETTLARAGAHVAAHITFADHHVYRAEDLQAAFRAAKDAQAHLVVTTQKDAANLAHLSVHPPGDMDVLVLAIRLRLVRNAEALDRALQRVLDHP